ncbi:MAG: acetate/propionate family kinase [Phycisphaeraceae bacterium]|nr:acetate/propionate family kinase [Phycisphaeraceae bacterium]
MILLIANLGSTSFKYKLFDMDPTRLGDPAGEQVIATGAADRIGQGRSEWKVETGGQKKEGTTDLADHGQAIDLHLRELAALGCTQATKLDAVGFKAVHGGPISGAVKVDDHVLATMEQFADVAPQHNPPYIAAMRAFRKQLPGVPQVAAFETAFHQTIPMARQVYGIPHEWTTKLGIRRYGFHGASHRYIATRMKQLAPRASRVISCHLGGSCSICAIEEGKSVANSFGMTAQSGTFHASRVGDFDAFALLKLLSPSTGLDLATVWKKLGKEAGLQGLSGVSADLRDVKQAAASGNAQAKLAIDAFVESCRHYVGSYLMAMHGVDAIAFTGGIGQNEAGIRAGICAGMDFAGISMDEAKNASVAKNAEARIDAAGSKAEIWVLPTNEELIVARQTVEVLTKTQR